MFKISRSTILVIILGLIVCVPVILPYFHGGYFPSHDGEWAVVRAGEMFREIRDHQFPPRYSGFLNFGYGYPLFNFAYPFPYYASTVLHFFKFGFVDSIKVIFAGSVLISFFAMYVLSFQFWKSKLAGFLSAILYIYLPYRLVDLYVRGSIGESMAFALYPFIFIFCFSLVQKKRVNISISCIAIFTAILALTHNISAVYFGIMFLVMLVACLFSNKKREALFLLGALLWGGLISAFFWMPAILEKHYITLSIIPIADRNLYYVSIPNLLFSKWGYGVPTDKNPFTYQLGIPQVLGLILSLIVILKQKDVWKNIAVGFFILTVIFILMMFPFASIVWKLPLLSEINYPWTLLLPIGFLMTFLGGAVAKTKLGFVISAVLIVLCLLLYLPWARPLSTVDHGDMYYLTNEATTTSSNELMPLWVKKQPVARFENKISARGQISDLLYSSNKIQFNVNSKNGETVTVNQIYYPGWTAYINGELIPVSYKNNQGVMQVKVSQGVSQVKLKFSETPIRMGTDLISILSLISLIAYTFGSGYMSFKNKHGKK